MSSSVKVSASIPSILSSTESVEDKADDVVAVLDRSQTIKATQYNTKTSDSSYVTSSEPRRTYGRRASAFVADYHLEENQRVIVMFSDKKIAVIDIGGSLNTVGALKSHLFQLQSITDIQEQAAYHLFQMNLDGTGKFLAGKRFYFADRNKFGREIIVVSIVAEKTPVQDCASKMF